MKQHTDVAFRITRNIVKGDNEEVIEKIGGEAFLYISRFSGFHDPGLFNIPNNNGALAKTPAKEQFNTIINLNSLNNLTSFNTYIGEINKRLIDQGLFIGCCETGVLKRKHVFSRFKKPVSHFVFSTYYIYHRVFPKLPLTKHIYRFFTKGKSIALSKTELFGRLYYSGFELVSEKEIGRLNYFVAKKTAPPCTNGCPTYFPIIKLKRVGQHGKKITVYKIRTMHPYSEYLQEYVYRQNNLDKGGKIKSDFRVSPLGTFLRKLWIDEIPMVYNLLRGDIKLVGVRPISEQYFNLYTEELKQLRVKHKPGLIPPFYADLPKTIEEIIESEKKYLLKYEKKPFVTDFTYLFKALFNMLVRGNLSK